MTETKELPAKVTRRRPTTAGARAGHESKSMPCPAGRRRGKLLDAAEAMFLKHGLHATNMGEVARQAGMSKKTLYQVFKTKEALFGAIVARHMERLIAPLSINDDAPIEEALLSLMRATAEFALSARNIGLIRLVIAETSPSMARAFLKNGPQPGRASMERWLERQVERGTLQIENFAVARSQLFALAVGDMLLGQLFGEPRRTKAARELVIQTAAQQFLTLYRTPTGKKPA